MHETRGRDPPEQHFKLVALSRRHTSDKFLHAAIGGSHIWVVEEEQCPPCRNGGQSWHPQAVFHLPGLVEELLVPAKVSLQISSMVEFGDHPGRYLFNALESKQPVLGFSELKHCGFFLAIVNFAFERDNTVVHHTCCLSRGPTL